MDLFVSNTQSEPMLKKIAFALTILIVVLAITMKIGIRKFHNHWFKEKPNYLTVQFDSKPFPFVWGEIGDDPYGLMKVPVKVKGSPYKFYMQFDTGAPFTVILENPIKSLEVEQFIEDETAFAKDFEFMIGENMVSASQMKIFPNYGNEITPNDTIRSYKLGTIGADFLDNKITVIDFKNQLITLYDERPEWMNTLPEFESFNFKGRRFMLPANLAGKKRDLFYDSGSSAFGLITHKSQYKKLTDKKDEEFIYDANSWGDKLPIRHKAASEKIEIGGAELDLKRVAYMDKYAWAQRLIAPFSKIGGWLGNLPFVESVLILDTKEAQFLVTESQTAS